MSWLKNLFSNLFRKKTKWDGYDYGKPSAANDEFRKNNEV